MAAAKRLIVCRSFAEASKSARGPSKKLPHAFPPPHPCSIAHRSFHSSCRTSVNSTSSPSTSVQCTCTCSIVQSQLSRRPQAGHECRWPPPNKPLAPSLPDHFRRDGKFVSSHRLPMDLRPTHLLPLLTCPATWRGGLHLYPAGCMRSVFLPKQRAFSPNSQESPCLLGKSFDNRH